jgi:fatty-acid desaturase
MNLTHTLDALFSKFLGRRTIHLCVLLIICLIINPVDPLFLILGIVFYYIIKPFQLSTWHDYLSHRQFRPKNKFIEILGLYILAVWEQSGPKYKVLYHNLHHKFINTDDDPTYTRLVNSKNFLYFCLDLGKLKTINYNKAKQVEYDSELPSWFDKYHRQVLLITTLVWLLLLPFWSWIVFWLTPVFFWNFVNRGGEYIWHHPNWQMNDLNFMVVIFSQNAWHNSHHSYDLENLENIPIDNGPGAWKFLNWDFYIRLLFFKRY